MMNPTSPLEHALLTRAMGPRPTPSLRPPMAMAPHIPKEPMMGMPRPRPFSRPIASGLRPSAMMPKFLGKL